MNVNPVEPARSFTVGGVTIRHVADLELGENELVTFRTESGSEYDVVRTPFGYYATPSLERRLPEHGLRPVLVGGATGHFVLLVERDKEAVLDAYLHEQSLTILRWLDLEPE
jgi:hypothetical protein